MNTSYIFIFLVLFLILWQQNQQQKAFLSRKITKKGEGNAEMFTLAQQFIGKGCIVYTFNAQCTGCIREVTEGALLLDNGKEIEIINFDFVTRIREYPRKKNGKKKSVIVD